MKILKQNGINIKWTGIDPHPVKKTRDNPLRCRCFIRVKMFFGESAPDGQSQHSTGFSEIGKTREALSKQRYWEQRRSGAVRENPPLKLATGKNEIRNTDTRVCIRKYQERGNMSMTEGKKFYGKSYIWSGHEVGVTRGLGGCFIASWYKSAHSIKRCPKVPVCETPGQAQALLDEFAREKSLPEA